MTRNVAVGKEGERRGEGRRGEVGGGEARGGEGAILRLQLCCFAFGVVDLELPSRVQGRTPCLHRSPLAGDHEVSSTAATWWWWWWEGGGGGGGVFGPPAGIRNRHPGWWGILLSPNRTVPLRFTRLAKDPLWVSYSFGVCFVASPLFVLVLVLPTFSIIRGIKKKREERKDRENSRTRIYMYMYMYYVYLEEKGMNWKKSSLRNNRGKLNFGTFERRGQFLFSFPLFFFFNLFIFALLAFLLPSSSFDLSLSFTISPLFLLLSRINPRSNSRSRCSIIFPSFEG